MKNEILIRIEGMYPQRLIRRSMAQGAVFKHIHRTGRHTATVGVLKDDAAIVLSLCRRYGISAKVIEKQGLPVLADRLRSRVTILAGIAAFVLICLFSLSRLWLIDIRFTGTQAHLGNEAGILSTLRTMNIHPGISNRIDSALLSSALEAEETGYSYISADISGIRLLIEAAPEIPEPETYDIGHARNLYASTDGVVESVEVHSGTPCVSPGDVIMRGQMLIMGEERLTSEDMHNIGALGNVIVRTWYEGTSSGSIIERKMIPTGHSAFDSKLQLAGFTFPITTGKRYTYAATEAIHVPIVGLYIPLSLVREVRYELQETAVEADMEALSDHLAVLAMADAAANLSLNGPDDYKTDRI